MNWHRRARLQQVCAVVLGLLAFAVFGFAMWLHSWGAAAINVGLIAFNVWLFVRNHQIATRLAVASK